MNYWQPAIVAFRSNYLPAYKAAVIYVPIRHLYICREPSTNQLLFMQNKPNFQKSQMNVSIFSKMAYENIANWTLGQNKPNSNPIKPNFRKAKMNVNSLITKDYRKKDDFAVQKNKPNSNPISVKPKMNANAFSQKDYENETAFRLQKYKPKQSQFQTGHQPPPTSYLPPQFSLKFTNDEEKVIIIVIKNDIWGAKTAEKNVTGI